jgi:hypothetical protein
LKTRTYKDVVDYLVAISDKENFEVILLRIEEPLLRKDIAYVLEQICDQMNDFDRMVDFSEYLRRLEQKDDYIRLNQKDEVLF